MKTNRWLAVVVASVLMIGMSGSAFAQAQGGNRGQNNNNGGRQRGNFDPAQMRERYMNQIKEQLASPDDEWKLIQPKLEKVLTAQRDTRSSRGFGNRGGRTRGGNNGDNQNNNNQPQSAVAQASEDLRKAVEDKGSSPEELTKKIATLREAREKAKADLASAQKDLRELLSARQEATLISNGILD
jgi:hypothetical protein